MSDEAFLGAIKAGDLQEIKRLHQGGHLENECPWDAWACRAAAEGGQLECLKYLHENGCPCNEWACRAAALRGHLECLKYLHENGCPWDAWTCRLYETLAYLKGFMESPNKCPYETAMATLDDAVREGMTEGKYKTIADALMHAHRAKRRRE